MTVVDDVAALHPLEEEDHLGSLLVLMSQAAELERALAAVEPRDFASRPLAVLWGVARELVAEGRRVTRRALSLAVHNLEDREDRTAALARLDRLGGQLEVPRMVDDSIRTVVSCGHRRRVVAACQAITQQAARAEDPSGLLQFAYDRLAAAETQAPTTTSVRFDALLGRFWESLEATDESPAIPTPWEALNDKLNGGLRAGRFYAVGARPGAGKSLMAHGMGLHAAHLGNETLVFSPEMPNLEVTGRMVAAGARVEFAEITRGDLSSYSYEKVAEFIDSSSHWPLSVVDLERVDMGFIRSQCRRHVARYGRLDVVVIDYLQLVGASNTRLPRQEQVAAISRESKLLSRELGCRVIVPCQLNRESAKRGDGRPTMAELRESGGIEADADVVMLLARGVVTEDVPEKGMPTDELNVFIDKNRQGPVGQITLRWLAHYAAIGE